MKTDWLFCCLVRAPSFIVADPSSVGMFELTKRAEARSEWETALQQSARASALTMNDDFLRARCFFLDSTFEDAHESGVLHARELVGLLPMLHPMTVFDFVRVGFLANLKNGAPMPFPPTFAELQRRRGGITMSLDEMAVEPVLTINELLVSHPSLYGELGAAVRRSTHWQALARQAEDSSEELLAQWMACESLSRVDVNESLTPKFVSGLGLPKGQYLMKLDVPLRRLFTLDPKVAEWTKKLSELFETMREARNKIAHAGYRGLDLPEFFDKDNLRLIRAAMRLLLPRLQGLALNGLRLRLKTIDAMWASFAAVFMLDRDPKQAAVDAIGNVIFSLESPERLV